MDPNVSALERAFELARSGRCLNVREIRLRLSQEGYNTEQISGAQLRTQLEVLIEAARLKSSPMRAGRDTKPSIKKARAKTRTPKATSKQPG